MTIKPWKVIESTHPRKYLQAKASELLQSMHVSALFYALGHLHSIG